MAASKPGGTRTMRPELSTTRKSGVLVPVDAGTIRSGTNFVCCPPACRRVRLAEPLTTLGDGRWSR